MQKPSTQSNLTDRNVSPKCTMYSNEPILSNALAIAAERAKDICDRLIASQENQGILQESMDARKVVKTLKEIARQNHWSLAIKQATQNSDQISLAYANSSFLWSVEFCQPQIKKYGSVEKFLNYAETLISVDENTRKAQ